MSRQIDMTPTWPEALRMCRMVLENGTDEGKEIAWTELERMAELAQQLVQLQRKAASVVGKELTGPDIERGVRSMTDIKDDLGMGNVPMSSCSVYLLADGDKRILPGNAAIVVEVSK